MKMPLDRESILGYCSELGAKSSVATTMRFQLNRARLENGPDEAEHKRKCEMFDDTYVIIGCQ